MFYSILFRSYLLLVIFSLHKIKISFLPSFLVSSFLLPFSPHSSILWYMCTESFNFVECLYLKSMIMGPKKYLHFSMKLYLDFWKYITNQCLHIGFISLLINSRNNGVCKCAKIRLTQTPVYLTWFQFSSSKKLLNEYSRISRIRKKSWILYADYPRLDNIEEASQNYP